MPRLLDRSQCSSLEFRTRELGGTRPDSTSTFEEAMGLPGGGRESFRGVCVVQERRMGTVDCNQEAVPGLRGDTCAAMGVVDGKGAR